MGIDFIAYDEDGHTVFAESCRWLRDWAPRELFWVSVAGKHVMTTEDIGAYMALMKAYLSKLRFVAADSEDEDSYDKWVSENGEAWIDDWICQKLHAFVGLLQTCIDMQLMGRWSI